MPASEGSAETTCTSLGQAFPDHLSMPRIDRDVVMASPLGLIGLSLHGQGLSRLDFLPVGSPLIAPATRLARQLVRELECYFSAPLHRFSIPLRHQGTPFQQRVWQALTEIPAGEVMTYGELAERLGSGARAIGNACRRNPVPLVVPCHRVVSRSGPGGYSGQTGGPALNRKLWLLAHEHES